MTDKREEDDPIPTREEVVRQLRSLMTRGFPAALPEDVEPLLRLHAVRVLALVDDLPSSRLAALRERIVEMTRGTRNERLRLLAPYAFGTYIAEDLPLERRLEHIGPTVGRGYEALRKTYLPRLANNFADRLLWLEERLRYNQWLERATDETLHDETLRQYDFYMAMGYTLAAAKNDLDAALEYRHDGDTNQAEAHALSALWRWTQYLRHAHRFDEAFFGELATSSEPGIDLGLAESAKWDVQAIPPLTPLERSWLRTQLFGALHEELSPFVEALQRSDIGQRILDTWEGWVRSCHCDPTEHEEDCTVGQFFDQATTFYDLMNEEISASLRTDRAARFQTLPDIYDV